MPNKPKVVTAAFGQEESLAKRKLPASERLLMMEADVNGPLLNDGRSANPVSGGLMKR